MTLTSFVYTGLEGNSNAPPDTFVEVIGLAGCTVYLISILGILTLSQWIFVLHYDASNLQAPDSVDGVNYGYIEDHSCQHLCCVSELHEKPKLLERFPDSGFNNMKRQGWEFTSDDKNQRANARSPCPTTLLTDMQFLRGSYKYSCSTFGVLVIVTWLTLLITFGVLGLVVPCIYAVVGIAVNETGDDVLYNFTDTFNLSELAINEFAKGGYGMFMAIMFVILIIVIPSALTLMIGIVLFIPLGSNRTAILRTICHICNITSCFQSYEVAILALIVTVIDGANILVALITQSQLQPLDRDADSCVVNDDGQVLVCINIDGRVGLVFGIGFSLIFFPFIYYFQEIYHRHFGLVADGRAQQAHKTGETTFKHRTEGVLVHVAWYLAMCSRKEFMFEQERVSEESYYAGTTDVVRFPSDLLEKFKLHNTTIQQEEAKRPSTNREQITKYLICESNRSGISSYTELKALPFRFVCLAFVTEKVSCTRNIRMKYLNQIV